MVHVAVVLVFVLPLLGAVYGDFACLCTYADDTPVYTDHRNDSSVLGYLYAFDCKPIAETSTEIPEFIAVQYKKSLGYVPFSVSTEKQTCQGSVPLGDKIPQLEQTTRSITETTLTSVPVTTPLPTEPETSTKLSTTEPETATNMTTTGPETLTNLSTNEPETVTNMQTTEPETLINVSTTKSETITPNMSITVAETITPITTKQSIEVSTDKPSAETSTTLSLTSITHAVSGPTTDHPVVVYETGLEWPAGTYGLMKAAQGCPDDSWKSGWRQQDTEDISSVNHFTESINLYLAGSFGDNIMTEFCIKDNAAGRGDWSTGSYCILKKHDCPSGFSQGYIFWDDEDTFNGNDKGGTLPDGEFGRNTRIYYCCRDDGDVNQEVALPTEHAFVLVRYSTECQRVRDMIVTDVHVRWDDDDGSFSSAETDVGGMHPVDEDQNEGHLLHFCHYQLPQETFIG